MLHSYKWHLQEKQALTLSRGSMLNNGLLLVSWHLVIQAFLLSYDTFFRQPQP